MDSITQAALGAIVGETVVGKRIGNRALILGAIIATIPDLDIFVLAYATDELTKLLMHRGATHSLIVMPIVALFLAFALGGGFKKKVFDLSISQWFQLFFWCFVTHSLLDLLTSFGTQVFYPFNQTRYAISSIFIIDLFYTLPLLAGIILLFFKSNIRTRNKIRNIVLVVSSIYLMIGIVTKTIIHNTFLNNKENNSVVYQINTSATPLSFLLWRVMLRDENDGYRVTYFSILKPQREPVYEVIERHAERQTLDLLLKEKDYFRKLLTFSKGFYRYSEKQNKIYFSDIRVTHSKFSPFYFQVAYRNPNGEIEALPTVKRVRTYRKMSISNILNQWTSKL